MKLADKLVYLRKKQGLSQLKLAEMMNVSRQAISRWETGIAVPSAENLKYLGNLYNVSLDYLFNNDVDEMEENEKAPEEIEDEIASPSDDGKEHSKKRKSLGKKKHHIPIHPLDSSRSYCRSIGELHPLQRCRQNLNCRRC